MARNTPDGTQGGGTELPGTFRNIVSHSEYLIRMLVKQQMVVAEVTPPHVPVEVLRFEIKRKRVGEQSQQFAFELPDPTRVEVGLH
jgi:hypothetical protein